MRKSNLRATAGWQALALLGAGVFIAAPAAAQDAPAAASNETQPSVSQQPVTEGTEAEADSSDEIVVTGSRIARPDLEAPSPVTTVSAEQFDLTGTVTVETLLNELPQLIPGNTRTSNNQGGEDFSTLDLRGLGPQRTLILVDGERVPASSSSGVVDIGTIPAGLIERVDVVTGGASAVYGSDAMAGVVNFVLKDNFEGMEISAQYGISEQGDGGTFNVQGLLGGNFGDDRGNMTFFASYYTRESVGQGDRDVTRNGAVLFYDYNTSEYFVADHLAVPGPGQVLAAPAGSGTNPYGTILNNASIAFGGPLLNVTGTARRTPLNGILPTFAGADTDCNPATGGANVQGNGNLSFNDAGVLTPSFTAGRCAFADRSVGSSRFNFNPLNYLVTPYDRWSMALTGRYDLNDSIRFKVIANYTDSSQEVNLAPTPATGIVVPANSPLIPADLAAALATRGFFTGDLTGATRFTSLDGFRTADPANGVTALSSCLRNADGTVRNATCTFNSAANAPFTIDRRFNETGPRVGIYDSKTATLRGTLSGPLAFGFNWDVTGSYGRTTAVATLRGNINRTALTQGLNNCPLGSLPGCVAIDIFGPGTVTGAALSFVNIDTKETREFDQARIAGNITGNLVELPAGPLGIAIGAEARTDRGNIIVDDAQRTGNIYGFNATQNQKGKVNVKEVYAEVRVPILADMPFFHDLSIEAGARYSDYSSVGSLFNYKFGAQWSPIEWVKFRGIYNKAARAPSIVELFQNGDQGFPGYSDFCNATPAGSRTAAELALCQAQAPAIDFGTFAQNNTQVQAFAFGAPNLSEETAKTFTAGVVLTPNIGLGRFSATIDYYNIKIEDLVTTLGAGFYLSACSASADPFSDACQRITRDQGNGQITAINTSIANQGTLKTSGVDAAVNFVVPFSDIGIGLPGRFRFQELVSWLDKYDFNGTDFAGTGGGGIGGTLPEWKSTMTAAYDSPSFTAQLRWNYQTKVQDTALCAVGTDCAPDIRALSYFDLSLRKKIGNNFELTGIVQNMFNAKAYKSVAGYFAEGGTDVSYYTPVILGRYFTISGKVKL